MIGPCVSCRAGVDVNGTGISHARDIGRVRADGKRIAIHRGDMPEPIAGLPVRRKDAGELAPSVGTTALVDIGRPTIRLP